MSFGLKYDQLTTLANNVRAGIVSYNGDIPEHQAALREALPRFLGTLGAVHGASFPRQHMDAVITAMNAKILDADFLQVAFEGDRSVRIAGLATGFRTFGAECDKNNNLKIFPYHHGEDMCVEHEIAKLFREYTKCLLHPNGIGAGTWFMREQILRSVSNPGWVFAGRDNEHSPENLPIVGLMDKFGAIHGTEHDSAVLQLDGLTSNMKGRWGVPVEKEDLPSQENIFEICPNNFLTRWASKDGKQQIVAIFTRSASTFEGQPIVWTKIKSNGNLPNNEMLKEVMASLLSAGCAETSSPNRLWGMSPLMTDNDLSRFFGGPVPAMHIHMSNEPRILKALLHLETMYRKFGERNMRSGVINPRNAPDLEKLFGRKLPDATEILGIDPERDANKPYFDFGPKPRRLLHMPERPSVLAPVEHNHFWSLQAA